MDIGQWLVIIFCVFLLLWYMLGWLYNRRRSQPVLTWMKKGLVTLGKPGETRWLSPLHSSAQMIVAEAHNPFRKLATAFMLEPRENFPVWIFRHAMGRRDELHIRAELRNNPAQEIEIAHKGRSEIATLVRPGRDDPFTLLPGTSSFDIAVRGETDDRVVEQLKVFLAGYEAAILRLSLQRRSPHLILRARLGQLLAEPSDGFFIALQNSLK